MLGKNLVILFLLCGVTTSAICQTITAPPSFPGFPKSIANGGPVTISQPAVANLFSNNPNKVIVYGDDQGRLNVVLSNGTVAPGFPVQLPAPIASSPAIGDVNGDGQLDIVVGYGTPLNLSLPGGVRAYTNTGIMIWNKGTLDELDSNGLPDPVYSTPAIGDVDGDGQVEVAFGSYDHYMYLVRGSDGQNKHNWPQVVYDTVWSSPCLFDLDGDGKLEIITGADSTFSSLFGLTDGGQLHVFRYDGMNFNGFPIPIDQVITGAPAVGDVDGDGSPDIVFGTGTFFPNPATHPGSPQPRTPQLYAVKNNGTLISGWPVVTDTFINHSPALADLTGDGKLDVVATGVLLSANPVRYRVEGFASNGTRLFSTAPSDFYGNSVSVSDPVIADVTGDSKPEILVATSNEVCILSSTGTQLTNKPPTVQGVLTLQTDTGVNNVVVSDLNNDNVLEIIAIAAGPFPNQTDTKIFVWNLNNTTKPAPVWGAFKQNGALRRGAAPGTPVGSHTRYVTPEILVANLYRDFLQREGSPSEIQAWASLIHNGQATRAEVALGFFNSVEFQRMYGTITRYYLGLLERAPEYNGLLAWVNILRPSCNATECSPAKRQEIVNSFIASPEFTLRYGGNLTNTQFVVLMYQNILKRTPAQNEINFWVNALNNGFTRGEMARQFVESDEYVLFISKNDTWISTCYIGFLHRGVEPGGLAAWRAYLAQAKNSQADLVQEFITTDEYLNRVNPGW